MGALPLIDYNKPIRYVTCKSPTEYKGFSADHEGTMRHVVAGKPYRTGGKSYGGNYYDDEGNHIYGVYDSVENVPLVETPAPPVKITPTDDELAKAIREHTVQWQACYKELRKRGYNIKDRSGHNLASSDVEVGRIEKTVFL